MNTSRQQYQSLFDRSACLRKRQMLALLDRKLFPEEVRAVEIHLATCSLCKEALEGLKKFNKPLDDVLDQLKAPHFPDIEINENIVYSPPSPILNAHIKIPQPPKKKRNFKWSSSLTMILLLFIGGYVIYEFEYKKEQTIQFPTQKKIPLKSPLFLQKNVIDQEDLIKSSIIHSLSQEPLKEEIIKESIDTEPDVEMLINENETNNLVKESIPTEKTTENIIPEVTVIKELAEEQLNPVVSIEPKDQTDTQNKSKAPTTIIDDQDFINALQAYQQNNFGTALLYLQNILKDKTHPKYLDALYYAALSQKGLGKTTAAIQLINELKKHPGHDQYDLDAFNN